MAGEPLVQIILVTGCSQIGLDKARVGAKSFYGIIISEMRHPFYDSLWLAEDVLPGLGRNSDKQI